MVEHWSMGGLDNGYCLCRSPPAFFADETSNSTFSHSFAHSFFNLTPEILAAAFTGVLDSALPRAMLLCPSLVLQAPGSSLGTPPPGFVGGLESDSLLAATIDFIIMPC